MSKYTQTIARRKFSNRKFGTNINHADATPMQIIRNGINSGQGFYQGSEFIPARDFGDLMTRFGRSFDEQANIYISRGSISPTDPKAYLNVSKGLNSIIQKKLPQENTYFTILGAPAKSYDAMMDQDRADVNSGKTSYAQWTVKYPDARFTPKTGLLDGIGNVISDAAKLAVAPVTLATGGDVKLTTGIGKVVGDASKIAITPITGAVSSIKGADVDLKLQTKAGKAVNAVTQTGSKALHGALKGFGDAVTFGYATKAANLIRSDENKEKAFNYTEMRPTKDKTGIKFVDKVTQVLPAVSAALGATAAAVVGGTKIADILGGGKDKPEGNLPDETTLVGPNVLDYQLPLPTIGGGGQPPLQAAFKFETWHLFAIAAAVIILVVVSKYAKK